MRQRDRRYLNTDSDSELLLNVFAHELLRTSRRSMDADAVFRAVRGVHKRCKGAYSVVADLGFGLVAFRDPYGIRPMVVGRRESEARGRSTWWLRKASRCSSSASNWSGT